MPCGVRQGLSVASVRELSEFESLQDFTPKELREVILKYGSGGEIRRLLSAKLVSVLMPHVTDMMMELRFGSSLYEAEELKRVADVLESAHRAIWVILGEDGGTERWTKSFSEEGEGGPVQSLHLARLLERELYHVRCGLPGGVEGFATGRESRASLWARMHCLWRFLSLIEHRMPLSMFDAVMN